MTAIYTFDGFASLDGFGATTGDWTGCWGKQGPELLDARLAQCGPDQHLVLGTNTYRAFSDMLATANPDSDVHDPWVARMRHLQTTVVSHTLSEPVDEWSHATIVNADAVDFISRVKADSPVPLRSHGSLSMNRALMAAGPVDIVQVTIFPAITGRTGADPIFAGAADFDLELVVQRRVRRRLHPDEMQRIGPQVAAFNDELAAAGAWLFGAGLEPASTATVFQLVRFRRGVSAAIGWRSVRVRRTGRLLRPDQGAGLMSVFDDPR